ncbi:hypothetical protein FOA52_003057 [Chlamydomonas sp. UWO 241]|nr:hypothetical protein FOA52_003057 [Chlamydomonas sp. UWO 241]
MASITGRTAAGSAAAGAPARRAVQEQKRHTPNGAQLFLQKMLMSTPLLAPLARQMADATAGGAAGLPAAAEPKGKAGKVPPRRALPKGLSHKDKVLWEMFETMDRDGNGSLDEAELRHALHDMGLPCSPDYVSQMMMSCHVPPPVGTAKRGRSERGGGSSKAEAGAATEGVSWEQFRQYAAQRDTEIDAAFRHFDADGNGAISGRELGRAMALAGLPTTGEDLMRIMDVLDKDHNDIISHDEFRSFACLVPQWSGGAGSATTMLQGFMHTMPRVATSLKKTAAQNPLAPYVVYDLMLRGSLLAALGVGVLVAIIDKDGDE